MSPDQSRPAADPLVGVAVLGGLDPAERGQVAQHCRLCRFAAGDFVIGEHRDGQEVVFVLEGRVRVVGRTASGRLVTFAEIDAGGHVGELAALDGGPRTADVEAIEPCLVAIMPPGAFRQMLEAYPKIALAFLRNLARVIRDADLRISELSTLGAGERLARELLRLCATGRNRHVAADRRAGADARAAGERHRCHARNGCPPARPAAAGRLDAARR